MEKIIFNGYGTIDHLGVIKNKSGKVRKYWKRYDSLRVSVNKISYAVKNLMAETFIPGYNPDTHKVILMDGNEQNVQLKNIKIVPMKIKHLPETIEKMEMASMLHKNGYSVKEISKVLGVSIPTIYRYLQSSNN